MTRCEVVFRWQKRLLTDLLSDSDGVELHLVLRRSELASHLVQPVDGWSVRVNVCGAGLFRGDHLRGACLFSPDTKRSRWPASGLLFPCRDARGMDASTENGSQTL